MICEKCGATVSEGTLICPTCGEKVALADQERKIKEAKGQVTGILVEAFASKQFLILTICLTTICVFSFLAVIGSCLPFDIWNFVVNLLIAIFSLISTIACWKLHGKKVPCNGENVKKYNKYNSLVAVLEIINAVLVGIVCFLILVVFVLGGACSIGAGNTAGSSGSEEGAAIGSGLAGLGVGLIIIGILIVAIAMTIVVNIVIAYKQTKNYGNVLVDTATYNQYKPYRKPPYIRLFIIGGFIAFGGIVTIVSSFFMNDFVQNFMGSLDSEIGDAASEIINKATTTSFLGNFLKALPELAAGGYLIITALFFKSVDEKEKALEVEVDKLQEEYKEIAERTEIEAREIANRQRFFGGQNNQPKSF